MHALDLMPHLPMLSAGEAQRWIHAALAQADALRQHDGRLYPLSDDEGAMETAHRLHEAWRRWAADAQSLQRGISPAVASACDEAIQELRRCIGFALGVVALPPEEALRRHQSVVTGKAKVFTTEEVRRELRRAPRG